jgi:enterochelin esterase family protein
MACGSSSPSSTGGNPDAPPGPTDPGAPPADATPDAPPPPATPPAVACVPAHTAPASLYDTFAALPASGRAAKLDAFLSDVAAKGGTPLEDGKGRAIFLVRGAPPSGPWSVVGSFVGWDKSKGVALTSVDGTDLWIADTTIPTGTSQTYKLLSGTTDDGWHQDALAKNLVWDGIDHHTVGEFNAVIHPADQPKTKGRIEYLGRVHATKLGDERDVFAYLPAKYDDGSCAKLPVVLVHDGNESLTRGDFAGAADELYATRPELASILVFVALPTQDVRIDEYTFDTITAKGDDYVEFLVSDLLPNVASSYRVCAKPAAHGISGASLGGLISTYAAFQKPGVFGWVGAQSPSLFWQNDALVDQAKTTSPNVPTRFYLDSGEPAGQCGDDDNCAITDTMEQTLKDKGYTVQRVKVMNAEHDWPYWRARFGGMLTNFRDGQTAVCD